MSSQFEKSVALVTGGAAGIGRATALAFAREGAKVVVADLKVDRGNELARRIEGDGGRALFKKTDVSKTGEVENLVAETVGAFGRLDCAVNNAGIEGELATTADCSEDNFDRIIGVNLRGVWLCKRAQIPQMIRQGSGGAIVNMASVAGLVGFPNLPAYVASNGVHCATIGTSGGRQSPAPGRSGVVPDRPGARTEVRFRRMSRR